MVRLQETPLRDDFIILYDGVCGLCNRLNRFVLNRDPEGLFRFASLQSRFAKEILARHSKTSLDLNTLYLVIAPSSEEERLLSRAGAVLHILKQIGGFWSHIAVFGALPAFVLDFLYDLVAKNRYRIFGKFDTCPLPEPKYQGRFIDI